MIYERSLKTLTLLVIMWLVSMFTIVSHYRNVPDKLYTPRTLYERQLKKLQLNRFNMTTNEDYDVWSMMKFPEMTLAEKYLAVKGLDFPPGMKGRPVYLVQDLKNPLRQYVRKGWVEHAFNEFTSSIIPLNRTLPDVRDPWCKQQNYSSKLPQTSVVICFHNEAWSTLLRTVHSVLDRSAPHLLKEIILFDDASTMAHLKDPLTSYIKTFDNVYLVRALKRQGLIRSRILAMRAVTAPVVILLDSHCECTEGWLEPLLDRISKNPTVVVSPVVDGIHKNSFEYIHQEPIDLRIGGFNWDLKFVWQAIPQSVLEKRMHPAEPVNTPTISGGLFAINKKFFEKLGYYDAGFDFWGAENLELSFKTWMCGGSLEIVPCSHVGHVFRSRFPYQKDPEAARRNSIRLAEVWLDEYAKYFFERIGNNKGNFGNVTKMIKLRKMLNCKSFQWYLKNVYPEMVIPEDYVASGKIREQSREMRCLDGNSNAQDSYRNSVKLLPCHFKGGNQFWVFTKNGEIKKDEFCLDYIYNTVVLNFCTGRQLSQIWIYNNVTTQLINMHSLRCLNRVNFGEGWRVGLQKCSGTSRQTWLLENYNITRLSPDLQVFAKKPGMG